MKVSICIDFTRLIADFPELVDPEGSKMGGRLRGWSGNYTVHNGNQSMKILTSIEGMDELAAKDYILVTTYEEIFGYTRQVEIDGVPQFGEPTITVVPAYTPQVITGYVDDLDKPIYVVVRHEKQKTRTVSHDEDGTELVEPVIVGLVNTTYEYDDEGEITNTTETPIMELDRYETTDEIEGYHSKPIYGDGEEIPEHTVETPNPIMEAVAGDATLKDTYDSIYDQSPTTDEDGNVHTPAKLFAVPGGYDVSHIL